MENTQRSKLDAYNRVADFNTKHSALLTPIDGYSTFQQKFDLAVKSIKTAGIAQSQQGTSSSLANDVKQAMADIINKYCLRAGVKARQLGNIALSDLLHVTASGIMKATKTHALEIAANKRNTLYNNLTILNNITAANISDIDKAIAAYNLIKDAPIETLQAKKSAGTDPLIQFYNDADDAETNMRDLILSYFSDTNKPLVAEFETASQVIATGIRSTSAHFTCLADENGTALPAFTVTDQNTNKTYQPDDKGIVTIDHHKHGHFHFTISSSGRTDVDFGTDIKRGNQNNFSIRLKKSA